MQSEMECGNSLLKTSLQCWQEEGVQGFYKGMSFPLSSVPVINAVVFAFHELSKRFLGFHDENEMNIYEGIISGSIAGFANCLIVTPVEMVKCRLQVQHENVKEAYYKGVIDCIRKSYRQGGIKALYVGNVATIFREVPAYSAQFGGYYYSKQLISKMKNKKVAELSNSETMLCGAVGGYFCWQFSYPQDVIKTLIQTSNDHGRSLAKGKEIFKSKFYDGGFWNCGKFIYERKGFFGFWRGYLPCTMRALIANSVLFVVYENTKEFLSHFHNKNKL